MKRYISAGLILCIILAIFTTGIGASAAAELPDPYARTMANAKEAYFYDALASALKTNDTPDSVALEAAKGLTQDDVLNGLELFICDNPEYFWLVRGGRISSLADGTVVKFLPDYYMSGNTLSAAKNALDSVVEEIMADLPDGSAYDKALYLHDEIAERTAYVQSGYHQTAYGALVSGQAVCAGYAAAYSLLLHRAGIRACSITGDSYNPTTGEHVPHAWTLLWLDASTCVYTDVTWDDQGHKGTFHYYFNISKGEIDEGHTPDSVFTLPVCSHTSSSYFDANDLTVNDSTSVSKVAAMFGPNEGGTRSAVIYYTGSNFANWYSRIISDLYSELGGTGRCTYSYIPLKNEYHLSIDGNFPTSVTYTVNIIRPAGIAGNSNISQSVVAGSAMNTVTLYANDGYYFPAGYGMSGYGVSVTRIDYRTVRISGTPVSNLTVELPAPTAKTAEARPGAAFTATGYDTGVLSGLVSGMKYSLDGGTSWHTASATVANISGVDPTKDILVKRVGNGTTTVDSAVQTIDVTRATAPTLTVTQPTGEGERGSVNTTSAHEYSTDGSTWRACGGALDGLEAGRYYIRVKAVGTALASANKQITVNAFSGGGEDEDLIPDPPGGTLPGGGNEDDDDDDTLIPPGGNIPEGDGNNGGGENNGNGDSTPEGGNIDSGNNGNENNENNGESTDTESKDDGDSGYENDKTDDGVSDYNERETQKITAKETASSSSTSSIGGVDGPTDINLNISCGSTLDGSALALAMVALLGSAVTFRKKH